MMGGGYEFTTKRDDPTQGRVAGVPMVHDGGVSSFEVVGDDETINLVEQS